MHEYPHLRIKRFERPGDAHELAAPVGEQAQQQAQSHTVPNGLNHAD